MSQLRVPVVMRTQLRGSTWRTWTHFSRGTRRSTGSRRTSSRAALTDAQEREFGHGEPVLVEDGDPASGLWVILTGSMDLVHEGEVIQVLEPGECFGHPSLLTGMAPAFTVRAREPSRVPAVRARRVAPAAGHAWPAPPTWQRRCASA